MDQITEITGSHPARGVTKTLIVLVAVISALLVNGIALAAQGELINIQFGVGKIAYPVFGLNFQYSNAFDGVALAGGTGEQSWNNMLGRQTWNNGIDVNLTNQNLKTSSNAISKVLLSNLDYSNYKTIINPNERGFAQGGVGIIPNGQPADRLMSGYMYLTGDNATGYITLTGLDPGAKYDLYVYSQREKNTSNDQLKISVNGIDLTTSPSSGTMNSFVNGQNFLEFANFTVDQTGELNILYQPGAGTDYAIINGIQLLQTTAAVLTPLTPIGLISGADAAPVPEPASMVLLGVGGILAAFRRFSKSAA